jgi:hypothetical protein
MCRRAFHMPSLIAISAPSQASCPAPTEDNAIPENKISHARYPPSNEDSVGPGMNPVETYPLTFGSRQIIFTPDKRLKQMTIYLCPGAKVTLANPRGVRTGRLKVDLNNITLQDLVNFGDDGQVASQIGLIN